MDFRLTFLVLSLLLINYSSAQDNIKFDGFFDFNYNNKEDKIYLKVDDLDQYFIYVNSLAQGVGNNDLGLDRGQLGNTRIVYFTKNGNKLDLVQPNIKFRSSSKNKLEVKSVEEAFAKSVIFSFKIIETSDDGFLVDFTDFLFRDAHYISNKLDSSGQGSYKLSRERSSLNLNRTKSFPNNSEFEALTTFVGNPKSGLIRSVTPDPNNITVYQHHSFIRLPDNNYQPRKFDPRMSSISLSHKDYSNPIDENINESFILRHRLEKKYPEKEISEPVEPIIYYLDNGTPEPVKSALIEGALWWNEAFEKIGYKDAFQVKILPDEADPLDVRYNVIQWVHRSTRGWSYGASVVNPLTGEILKGHVSLGSLRVRQDYMIFQGLSKEPFRESNSNDKILELSLDRIKQLSAHEVGHTLGFAHNFASSTNSRSSVMDYPHPLLSYKDDRIIFENVYDKGLGKWDVLSVEYAYSNNSDLEKIASKANSKDLRYISDNYARPKNSAHPYAHLWDNGKDPVMELEKILKIREIAISQFNTYNLQNNRPISELEDVFVPIYLLHRYQIEAVSKIIGGVEYYYQINNSEFVQKKYLNKELQLSALNALLKTVHPDVLAVPKNKLKLFNPRSSINSRDRESFSSNLGEEFDPISVSANTSRLSFDLMLDPSRLSRISLIESIQGDSFKLETMLKKITDHVFNFKSIDSYKAQISTSIKNEFVESLFNSFYSDKLSISSKVKVFENFQYLLNKILDKKNITDKMFISMIEKSLDDPSMFKMKNNKTNIPDGSPIGSFLCY